MLKSLLPSAPALYTIFLLLPPALCHMEMSWPYPLRSKFNPATPESMIDYSMTSPLEASGSNYPCKGYQNDADKPVSITYTAGSTYNMSLHGTAVHGGGSCQLSLSYDNGQSFKVIKSMIGGCPLTDTYDFTIPASAPSGDALFAWTWQNKLGNREFYMNCAAVNIQSGSSSKKQRREGQVAMNNLPGVWKANLESVNSCTTSEGEEPVYPEPGPEVEYGDGMSSSSPPTTGDCNGAPSGKTYAQPSVDSSEPAPASSAAEYSDSAPSSTASSLPATTPAPYAISTSPNQISAGLNRNGNGAAQTYSTMTVTVDCPSTVTSTLYPTTCSGDSNQATSLPPTYTTSAPASSCTGTSASCPCAPGYDCRSVGTCTWACVAQGLTSSSGFMTYTVTGSISPTTPAAQATTSVAQAQYTSTPASNSGPGPGYATSDLSSYNPCVPGTFICTSSTTWYTCNTASTYDSPRQVAAGMECLPNLSPYTSSTSSAQQGNTQQGYYRDDRYVRTRPNDDCSTDGALQCTNGGQGFEVCDQGGWVDMGSVAAGTSCQDGAIVAS